MANIITICDQYKNKEKLGLLVNELNIDRIVLYDEVDEIDLNEYKIIVFILNPYYIGNEFFIGKVREITKSRKNTRSIIFAIDGKEKLDKRELMKVKLEIESSLQDLIDNPKVYDISINLAVKNKRYLREEITLEEIRRDKDVFYTDEEGFLISGNEINDEHIYRFRKISNIDLLKNNIEETLKVLENKDVSKASWYIIGDKNSGKSTIISNLNYLNKSMDILEINEIENINLSGSEGIIILLGLDMEKNIVLLRKMKNVADAYKKVVILNKIDELMYIEEDGEEFIEMMNKHVKKLLREEIICLSSYYAKKWINVEEGKCTIEQVMSDPEIVILDKFGIPILKFTNEKRFLEKFEKQNYINKLMEVERKLCLNHLQK